MSDDDLRATLLKLGYDVPQVVIGTWGGYHKHTNIFGEANRRMQVERWVAKMKNIPRHRRQAAFPQFLSYFDVNRSRHAQRS